MRSRRQFLQTSWSGTCAAALSWPALAASRPADSLESLARLKGLRFGTSLSGRGLTNAKYLELVTVQCGPKPLREAMAAAFRAAPGRRRRSVAGVPA